MELRLAEYKLGSLSGAPAPDASTLPAPTGDGDRLTYARSLMSANDFIRASQMFSTVIGDTNDAKSLFAVGDMCSMVRALDAADAAYKRVLLPEVLFERAQRGQKQVAQLRQTAIDTTKIAKELADEKQWDGAIAKFREALSSNPMLPKARFGLAEALDDGPKDSVATLSESAKQYQYYVTLATDLTPRDREHYSDLIEKLNEKVDKLKQKEERNR